MLPIQDTTPPPTVVEAVEVRPARLPPAQSEAAFSVIRLDEQDLEGRQRLDQAIAQAPGASLFRRNDSLAANPTTQGLTLRSIAPSGAGRALVTLDGVPLNDPFGGWVIWAALPPELVSDAAIIRGGGAGPYGAGALTGTVELYERTTNGLIADARYGERDTGRATFFYQLPVNQGSVMLAASNGRSDGYIPVRAGRGAADTALSYEDWSAAFRVNYNMGESTFSARLNAYDEDRQSGLVGAAARAQGYGGSMTLARPPSTGVLGYRLQGWARKSDLANSSVAVAAGRASTTPANNQFETPATGYGFNAALRGATPEREWEVGLDVRAATGETHELFNAPGPAFVFLRERRAGGDTFVGGAYAEGTWKAGDLTFTGGVRADHWKSNDAVREERLLSTGAITLNQRSADRDGWLPTARTGVRKDFGDSYVRAAAYAGFRAPTINELHRPFRVGNDITEANPGLEPERLYGIEAAYGWGTETIGFNATLFYNELEDAVTNVTVGIPPAGGGVIPGFPQGGFVPGNGVLRQRQNAGTISATGLEADAWWRPAPTLTTRFAASYTDAEVDGGVSAPQLTGLRPAQAPEFTATAGAEWAPIERLSLSGRVRYESARFDDDLNSRELGSALMVDLRAAFRVNDTAEIYLAADNAFDEDVQTAVTADGVFSYAAPSTISVGVTIRR